MGGSRGLHDLAELLAMLPPDAADGLTRRRSCDRTVGLEAHTAGSRTGGSGDFGLSGLVLCAVTSDFPLRLNETDVQDAWCQGNDCQNLRGRTRSASPRDR